MQRLTAALVVLTLVPVHVAAAGATLPFALGTLRWTMSETEAAAVFPPLKSPGHARQGDPLTNQSNLIVDSYRWQNCEFRIVFYFASSGLSTIALNTRSGSSDCADAVSAELHTRYGAETRLDSKGMWQFQEWRDASTVASYNAFYGGKVADVTLMQVGGPQLSIAN